jgi:hypothetical protein
MKNILTFATICMLASVLSGCAYVSFETTIEGKTTKAKYWAPAFGSKQFGKIDLIKGTVEGVRSDQSQMAEVIAQGVASGINQARVP